MRHAIKYTFAYVCLSIIFIVSNQSNAANKILDNPIQELSINVGVYQHSVSLYREYLTGDICDKLTNVNDVKHMHRIIIEQIIMCFAFKEQGIKLNINPVFYPNLQRGVTMVEKGIVDALQVTLWYEDIDLHKLHASAPIIRKGEYEKGIYVFERHPLLNKGIDNIDFNKYIGITKKAWRYDWQIVNQLTSQSADVNHMPSLFTMLKNGRADFTLHDFSSLDDFVPLESNQIKLLPIKGVKVVIHASRHFVISKKAANSGRYINVLNEGIAELRKNNKITELYRQAGFFNKKISNWRILN